MYLSSFEWSRDHQPGRCCKRARRTWTSGSLVPSLMLIARTVEVVAGFSLAFGIYPQLTAVAILAFLFPATLTAHASWQVACTASFSVQLLDFFKNAAMMGGLLFIAATQSQPTLLRALRCQTVGDER
jgi:uncharacterized membrane protein YphA (DoxX/SURF4 family)